MRIEHLEIFLDAAETQSFTETAEKMNMSQPAVSLAISAVEKQVGFTVFSRSHRKMILTPAGESLYKSIKAGMNGYHLAIAKAKQVALNGGRTPITIGICGFPFEFSFLPKIVKKYCEERPNLDFNFKVDNYPSLIKKLENDDLDLIIAPDSRTEKTKRLAHFSFNNPQECIWQVLIPKDHSLSHFHHLKINDLNGHKLIFLNTDICSEALVKLQNQIESECPDSPITFADSTSAQTMMVLSGQGVAIRPDIKDTYNNSDYTKVPLDIGTSSHYGIITQKYSSKEETREFISWLKEQKLN